MYACCFEIRWRHNVYFLNNCIIPVFYRFNRSKALQILIVDTLCFFFLYIRWITIGLLSFSFSCLSGCEVMVWSLSASSVFLIINQRLVFDFSSACMFLFCDVLLRFFVFLLPLCDLVLLLNVRWLFFLIDWGCMFFLFNRFSLHVFRRLFLLFEGFDSEILVRSWLIPVWDFLILFVVACFCFGLVFFVVVWVYEMLIGLFCCLNVLSHVTRFLFVAVFHACMWILVSWCDAICFLWLWNTYDKENSANDIENYWYGIFRSWWFAKFMMWWGYSQRFVSST
jgi:hypothetical protein